MQLGFMIPLVGPSISDASALSAFVRGVEDLGYDALWVGDRLVTPVDVGSNYLARGPQMTRSFDPVLLLTVAAAATSRVRLNTSTLSTFYYEPPHLARQLTTLDVLSDAGTRVRAALHRGGRRAAADYSLVGDGRPGRGRTDRRDAALVARRVEGHSIVERPQLPKECPASTYGPGTSARASSSCRSAAICAPSGGLAAGSLQPRPARSYTHTLLSRATAGAINPIDAAEPPPPGSRITVGPCEPVHSRWRRYGPTSTS